MKLHFLIYVAVVLSNQLVNIQAEEKIYHITDKIMSCSSYLSNIISKFCDNSYKIVKRDTSLFIDKLTPRSMQEHRKRERLIAGERWRRVRRQIASECCERSCTIGDMIKYCPDDAKLIKERPDIFV